MKYRDSPAALDLGVLCLVFLHSPLHYGVSLLKEKEPLWTTIDNLQVLLIQPLPGSVWVSRSGNSCPELQTKRAIFNCIWSSSSS